MNGSNSSKYAVVLIIGVIVVLAPLILLMPYIREPPIEIKFTLFFNEGVMIEFAETRIYIDPFALPDNYTDFPADAILITHQHWDHYSPLDIQDIMSDDTLFVCPENMTDAIEQFGGLGVNPGDSFLVGDITITAFHMYTPDYDALPSSHPRESNSTSYIIDINGFTIFHAGDAKYMDEYEELTETIDVAFLPIYYDPGYGALNESLLPIVDVINTIQPNYTIPIHFTDENREIFISEYSILIENPSCEILNLPYWTSRTFVLNAPDT